VFSPGTLLDDRYEVIELLGRGGMGEVWRARRRLLGDEVAIKAIRPIDAGASAERDHFLRESRACAQLRHPHIVSILDFDVAPGGEPFLVMELLNGPSLREEIRRRGRLPLDEVVGIAGPLANAVQLAHDRGFVHRDLKPANLVSHRFESGEVVWKVIDFGLADLVSGNDETRPSSGREVAATALYAAPEQLRGGDVDHRADVYAFGALLFEALSGRPPFPDGDLLAVVTAHLSQVPPRLSELGVEVPARVEDALARALEKDPHARWPRIVDLAEALAPEGAAPSPVHAGGAGSAWPRGLGRYVPEGRIARGRLGSDIVAARHRVLDTRVAVRLLRRATTPNWEAVRTRFLHEARALQVVHPAILLVLDAGEEDGLLYLVTDLVEGRSLREVLARDGALDAGRLVRFARQLFDAAAALHARGSVLCGLSPEIVRTTGEGAAERLVVSTGGIAQVQDLLATLSEDTLRGAGVLDPELPYVAPEVFLGHPADARADLFTLGVLVYEMATARLPFQAANMQQLIGTAISVRPHDPRLLQPGMPDAVADLALRCLSANPADRPASAADALASLSIASTQ
jgi:serine/threonine protein kinase